MATESPKVPIRQTADFTQGRIQHVKGKKDGRGVPELFSSTLRMTDGTVLETVMPEPPGVTLTTSVLPAIFEHTAFNECPICLVPNPTSREHVPPHSIGGKVLTLSCDDCNNRFGSNVEPHLINWYEQTYNRVSLEGTDVRGKRHAGQFLIRLTPDGTPVLFQEGKADPAINEILRVGEFSMSFTLSDEHRAKIGAIKSAYLAACVLLGEIPRTPKSEQLRAELLRARDFPKDERYRLPEELRKLQFGRSSKTAEPGKLELAVAKTEMPTLLIAFNRYLAVEWPFEYPQITVHETESSDSVE